MADEIILGKRYRDSVSGWEGTAVARYEYLNGCVRYALAAADKDGKPEEFVFDEQQIISAKPVPQSGEPELDLLEPPGWWGRRTGGDRSNRPVPR